MSTEHPDFDRRVEIPNDILVTDAEFCAVVLAGATRRTATRLEIEGLPYAFIGGRKYRPLNEGRAWLAGRIQRRNQKKPARRSVGQLKGDAPAQDEVAA
jgi:hypothetical protein